VEEAQEDVQGADGGGFNTTRRKVSLAVQGHAAVKSLYPGTWSWRRPYECGVRVFMSPRSDMKVRKRTKIRVKSKKVIVVFPLPYLMAPNAMSMHLHGPAVVMNTCPFHVPSYFSFVARSGTAASNSFFFRTWAAL